MRWGEVQLATDFLLGEDAFLVGEASDAEGAVLDVSEDPINEDLEDVVSRAEMEAHISKVRSAEQRAKSREIRAAVNQALSEERARFQQQMAAAQTQQQVVAYKKRNEEATRKRLEELDTAFTPEWGRKILDIVRAEAEEARDEAVAHASARIARLEGQVVSLSQRAQRAEGLQAIQALASEYGLEMDDEEFQEILETSPTLDEVEKRAARLAVKRMKEGHRPRAATPVLDTRGGSRGNAPAIEKLLSAAGKRGNRENFEAMRAEVLRGGLR